MKRLFVAMVVGALTLTACGQGEIGLGAAVSAQSGEASENSTSGKAHKKARPKSRNAGDKAATPEEPSRPAAECSEATGGGDHLAQLTEIRVGTHDGYDRIVFQFAPPENGPSAFGVPRYRLSRLIPPITEDGSGRPVAVDGAYHAGIVFQGGTGVDMTTSDPKGYKMTYTGSREIRPRYRVLTEAQQTGDYEATLSWAFGLNESSCWRVSELSDPMRVVVDFLH